MALVATQGLWMPGLAPVTQAPAFNTAGLIDATGEKFAMIGRVWNKDRATKNITKIGFRFGAVTKAGGSALTVSLQDVDLVNGPPFQPDGTQDQTVAIANANAAFVSNTWIQTGALNATRTVAYNELLAVVVEYDGAGRLGADSVIISGLNLGTVAWSNLISGPSLFTASWALGSGIADVILEFDDGTFGTLDNAWPMSATGSTAYNSGSAADEVALQFTVPFLCKVGGAWVVLQAAAGADFDIVLYNGTTALATVSSDSNAISAAATVRPVVVPFAEQTLIPGATYYLSVKPTTTNSVTFYDFSVNDANHFQALYGGTSWQHVTRVDAGAWNAATATKRPFAGIRLSALDDGSGYPASRVLLGM